MLSLDGSIVRHRSFWISEIELDIFIDCQRAERGLKGWELGAGRLLDDLFGFDRVGFIQCV